MKIKKNILSNMLELAKEAYPREAGGLMLGGEVVDDFVLIPGQFNLNNVTVKLNQLPIYTNKKGTFHSHPSRNPNPSQADKSFFSKMGQYHLIIAKPYKLNSLKAYNNRGEETEVELVD